MEIFMDKNLIRTYASEVLRRYEKDRGKKITFPIDAMDVFERLFGLDTVIDTNGVLNQVGTKIIGCLYPDGCVSPWGKDKLIAVNKTTTSNRPYDIEIFFRNENFTVAHEGGHYVLQFLKGITGEKAFRTIYCRKFDRSPLEWQADFFAGELLQPVELVQKVLGGKQPGEVVDVDSYSWRYREFFNASLGMMEARLKVLGYKLINAKYEWAKSMDKVYTQECIN